MRRLILGLAIALVAGLVPVSVNGDDNAIRQYITNTLKMEQQRGTLSGFHLNLRVDHGTVWYEGFVSTDAQKAMILRTAQQAKSLGVVQIVDDIEVRGGSVMSDYSMRQTTFVQDSHPSAAIQEYSPAPSNYSQVPVHMNAAPMQSYGVPMQGQPMPISYTTGAGIVADNPSLPGYAWPGYAAHPNYAAVTYPQQYSPSAWPYIGPFYPYPQVPLGWRKVTLQWDDGWWYLDFHNK
ncbi:MAG TPA: BON domain-containing protein [Pirellulaceae bacterium]|nr:BON domain-containing protein [Pirellulaceae bacterium]HMO90558.1 BON domain-containing protein [Pirellulaceae bacterium]HMP71223.1 BON domain-containing protein [Pirellulaceae bacterium]